jgi:hypothetical protein
VDLVAALGQLQSELGGDYTAAAVGGITGYSDSHPGRLPLSPALDWMDLSPDRFSGLS